MTLSYLVFLWISRVLFFIMSGLPRITLAYKGITRDDKWINLDFEWITQDYIELQVDHSVLQVDFLGL